MNEKDTIMQEIEDNNANYTDWELKLNDISNLTFDELDTYINNNVTDLASAKLFLKKLSKVVLANVKITKDRVYKT